MGRRCCAALVSQLIALRRHELSRKSESSGLTYPVFCLSSHSVSRVSTRSSKAPRPARRSGPHKPRNSVQGAPPPPGTKTPAVFYEPSQTVPEEGHELRRSVPADMPCVTRAKEHSLGNAIVRRAIRRGLVPEFRYGVPLTGQTPETRWALHVLAVMSKDGKADIHAVMGILKRYSWSTVTSM